MKQIDRMPRLGENIIIRQTGPHGERLDIYRPARTAHVKEVALAKKGLCLVIEELKEPIMNEVVMGFFYTDEQGGADIIIMYFKNSKKYNSLVFFADDQGDTP